MGYEQSVKSPVSSRSSGISMLGLCLEKNYLQIINHHQLKPRSYFKQLVNVGTNHTRYPATRRNLQLANFISFWLALSITAIIVIRYSQGSLPLWFFLALVAEAGVFISLIGLNYLGLTLLSRFLLCWIPSIILVVNMNIIIVYGPAPETSLYLGFRIFQITFSIFPFLVFNLFDRWKLFIAASVPVLLTLFFDPILDSIGVGYNDVGLNEPSYYYNNFRAFLSLSLIGASFIFLKNILEKKDRENLRLIGELEAKNAIIRKNADRQVQEANERLSFHISNTPVAVIERDKNFNIFFWNQRAEELFGWSADEVKGKRPQDFMVDARDRDKAHKSVNEALQKKRNSNVMEVRTLSKSGKVLNCLWYYSFVWDDQGELQTVLSFVTDITEQRVANYYLNERVKELTTLYNVSQLLTNSQGSMHAVFEQLPYLLPSGWQFTDCCAARLTVFDNVFQTENFIDTSWRQSVDIRIEGREVGSIEVAYLHKPVEGGEIFLKEEENLLRVIAQMLQVYIERKQKDDELKRTQANLTSAINNTEILIWSVDVNFNIIAFNEASRKHALERYNVDVTQNKSINIFPEPIRSKWISLYKRVLSGEILSFEEQTFGLDFKYSLSPIIENHKVIGAVVFVDNVTEEKRQQRALTEANNKINELRVMALRSVMNPHFIFNVLSSIQFFITRNDELNAINYLTSFSKLMRTVLTRSVEDAVTLREELDLLKDYVHLEKLRFEDKFELVLAIDPELNPDDIRIPSLLVQPYVENAILHGLNRKVGKGILKISVQHMGEFVNFHIEDDGVGRAASRKFQEQDATKSKSMGTGLTEERLAIINGDGYAPVKYTDLFLDGRPAGTKVTIRIKIKPN